MFYTYVLRCADGNLYMKLKGVPVTAGSTFGPKLVFNYASAALVFKKMKFALTR